jgi:hypothetical protein
MRLVEMGDGPVVRAEETGLPPGWADGGSPFSKRRLTPLQQDAGPLPAPYVPRRPGTRQDEAGTSWGWLSDDLRSRQTRDASPPTKSAGASWLPTPVPDDPDSSSPRGSGREGLSPIGPSVGDRNDRPSLGRPLWTSPFPFSEGDRAMKRSQEKEPVPVYPRGWAPSAPATHKSGDEGQRRRQSILDRIGE